MKKKYTDSEDIKGKWDKLEQSLELLIENNADPVRQIYQDRLNEIRKKRADSMRNINK